MNPARFRIHALPRSIPDFDLSATVEGHFDDVNRSNPCEEMLFRFRGGSIRAALGLLFLGMLAPMWSHNSR